MDGGAPRVRGQPLPADRLRGYPGRLSRRLGDRARVVSRGIPAATTLFWLKDLRGPAQENDPAISYADVFRLVGWEGFDAEEATEAAPSLLLATLRADPPDLVILLIGVNDFVPELIPQENVVELAAARLADLRLQAESVADHVLVSTLLPNERDSLEDIGRLNARIRSEHPDFLPLGEEFAARPWRALLGDGIHPNEDGYELLAELLEEHLVQRGLVEPSPSIRRQEDGAGGREAVR